MIKDTKFLLISGFVLIALTYLVLYTPLSNIIFGVKEVNTPAIPNNSLADMKKKDLIVVDSESTIKKQSEIKKIVTKLPEIYLRNPFSVGFNYEKGEHTTKEAEVKKVAERFVLQGIFNLSEGQMAALIDDKMLSEGQSLYGWTISQILSDRVALVRGRNVKLLRLKLGVE